MRRAWYWLAVLLAAGVTVAGCMIAYAQYQRSEDDPSAVVRAYFTALAHDDAPDALALGDPAPGSHAYLTSEVLRDQLRVAPISKITVTDENGTGATRTVRYSMQLGFAAGARTVSGHVTVRREGSSWRLAQTAVREELDATGATSRFTIAGAEIPDEPITLFPGAVPVLPDTPNLRPSTDGVVSFGGSSVTQVGVEVSTNGRTAVLAAMRAMLIKCFPKSAPSGAQCPLPPDPRVVPTSVRGTLNTADLDKLDCSVSSNASGEIEVAGSVRITGSYQHLDGNNLPHTVRGTFGVYVSAVTPSVGAPRLQFEAST